MDDNADDGRSDITLAMSQLRSKFFQVIGDIFIGDANILKSWKVRRTQLLHDTAWRVFHLLSLQVSVLGGGKEEIGLEEEDDERRTIFNVLFDEMSRVKNVLEERANIETTVTVIAKRSSMHTVSSPWHHLSESTSGVTIPDVPLRKNSTSFALSMWVKLDAVSLSSDTSTDLKPPPQRRRVLCMSTRPVTAANLDKPEDDVDLCPALFVTYDRRRGGSRDLPSLDVIVTTRNEETCVYNLVSTKKPMREGVWEHVVVTFDGETLKAYLNGVMEGDEKVYGTSIRRKQRSRPIHLGACMNFKKTTYQVAHATQDVHLAMIKFNAIGSINGILAGVAWHEDCPTDDEVASLSMAPNPSNVGKKFAASNYAFRLSSLLLSLTRTSVGMSLLSGSDAKKWVVLLLELVKYGSSRVQRPVLRILSILLGHMNPSNVVAPTVRLAVGSGHSAAVSSGRGAAGVWDYLSHIVGVAWWCSSSDASVAGDVNSVLSQFLPSFMLSGSSDGFLSSSSSMHHDPSAAGSAASAAGSSSVGGAGAGGASSAAAAAGSAAAGSAAAAAGAIGSLQSSNHSGAGEEDDKFGQVPGSLLNEKEHNALASRVSLMSDIVRLLRELMRQEEWSSPLAECVGRAMEKCASRHREWVQSSSDAFEKGMRTQSDIGGAITSLYMLGWMPSQQPHIGMRVRVSEVKNRVAPLELRSSVGMDTTSPIGTVIDVDWNTSRATVAIQNKVGVVVIGAGGAGAGGGSRGFNTLVAVPLSHLVPEVEEILHECMGNERIIRSLVSMSRLTLTPNCTPDEEESVAVATSSSPSKRKPTSEETRMTRVLETKVLWDHLTSRCLRALSNIIRMPSVAEYVLSSGLLPDLMRLAVYDVSSTAASAVSIVDMHSTDPDDPSNGIHSDAYSFFLRNQVNQHKKLGGGTAAGAAAAAVIDGSEEVDTTVARRSVRMLASLTSPSVCLSTHLAVWVSVPALEHVSALTWSRLHSAPPPLSIDQVLQSPRLERLGGIVKIDQGASFFFFPLQ
jgi:hypothetical protein